MTLDDLYAADLADFIATRDALVKQLKAGGDREGAASVKALRKPSTVAWGLNRVARENGEAIEALLAAGAAVREAQVKAVQGDGGSLRDASKNWRTRINELAGKVGKLVGEQYRDEAAASFEAASIDEDLAEVLRAGHFTAAVEAAGFGLGGMPDVPLRVRGPEPQPDARPEPSPVLDDSALEDARADLAAREKRLEQALHRLRRAEQRLDQAREAVDEARLTYEETLSARDTAASVVKGLIS